MVARKSQASQAKLSRASSIMKEGHSTKRQQKRRRKNYGKFSADFEYKVFNIRMTLVVEFRNCFFIPCSFLILSFFFVKFKVKGFVWILIWSIQVRLLLRMLFVWLRHNWASLDICAFVSFYISLKSVKISVKGSV